MSPPRAAPLLRFVPTRGGLARRLAARGRVLGALAALALLVGALACARGRAEEAAGSAAGADKPRDFVRYEPGHVPLDFIKVVAVEERSGATAVSLPGKVAFDEDHTQRVASPIDGRAVAILVKLGDKVRAGQTLLSLSSPSVGLIQAEAQKSLSELALAEKTGERVRKLQAEGAVAEKEVAQAESEVRKARADHARAAAQLKALGLSSSEPAVGAALRAQIPGVVVERNVLVGQEIRADQTTPLFTVSSLDTVWVLAEVYEQDLGLVALGDAVAVEVPAYPGERFPGKVIHVGEVVDPATRTVKLRCAVPNPGHRLKPEMFAKVEVRGGGGRKAIAVPAKAVLSDGDKALVIVASEGNVFRARRVAVGPESDGQVRILDGLKPGEKIVTDGAIFMRREIETQ